MPFSRKKKSLREKSSESSPSTSSLTTTSSSSVQTSTTSISSTSTPSDGQSESSNTNTGKTKRSSFIGSLYPFTKTENGSGDNENTENINTEDNLDPNKVTFFQRLLQHSSSKDSPKNDDSSEDKTSSSASSTEKVAFQQFIKTFLKKKNKKLIKQERKTRRQEEKQKKKDARNNINAKVKGNNVRRNQTKKTYGKINHKKVPKKKKPKKQTDPIFDEVEKPQFGSSPPISSEVKDNCLMAIDKEYEKSLNELVTGKNREEKFDNTGGGSESFRLDTGREDATIIENTLTTTSKRKSIEMPIEWCEFKKVNTQEMPFDFGKVEVNKTNDDIKHMTFQQLVKLPPMSNKQSSTIEKVDINEIEINKVEKPVVCKGIGSKLKKLIQKPPIPPQPKLISENKEFSKFTLSTQMNCLQQMVRIDEAAKKDCAMIEQTINRLNEWDKRNRSEQTLSDEIEMKKIDVLEKGNKELKDKITELSTTVEELKNQIINLQEKIIAKQNIKSECQKLRNRNVHLKKRNDIKLNNINKGTGLDIAETATFQTLKSYPHEGLPIIIDTSKLENLNTSYYEDESLNHLNLYQDMVTDNLTRLRQWNNRILNLNFPVAHKSKNNNVPVRTQSLDMKNNGNRVEQPKKMKELNNYRRKHRSRSRSGNGWAAVKKALDNKNQSNSIPEYFVKKEKFKRMDRRKLEPTMRRAQNLSKINKEVLDTITFILRCSQGSSSNHGQERYLNKLLTGSESVNYLQPPKNMKHKSRQLSSNQFMDHRRINRLQRTSLHNKRKESLDREAMDKSVEKINVGKRCPPDVLQRRIINKKISIKSSSISNIRSSRATSKTLKDKQTYHEDSGKTEKTSSTTKENQNKIHENINQIIDLSNSSTKESEKKKNSRKKLLAKMVKENHTVGKDEKMEKKNVNENQSLKNKTTYQNVNPESEKKIDSKQSSLSKISPVILETDRHIFQNNIVKDLSLSGNNEESSFIEDLKENSLYKEDLLKISISKPTESGIEKNMPQMNYLLSNSNNNNNRSDSIVPDDEDWEDEERSSQTFILHPMTEVVLENEIEKNCSESGTLSIDLELFQILPETTKSI